MVNLVRVCVMCLVVLAIASPAMAQAPAAPAAAAVAPGGFSMNLGAAVGAGIIIVGAALGIGKIGSHAVEGMSRQPEAAGNIQTGMIIAAALIEGATFFALIVVIIKG